MLSLVWYVVFAALGVGDPTTPLPHCPTEDSVNCVWYADVQGNGHGQSFVNLDGEVIYITGRS